MIVEKKEVDKSEFEFNKRILMSTIFELYDINPVFCQTDLMIDDLKILLRK